MMTSTWFASAAAAALAITAAATAATPSKPDPLDPGVITPHYGSWGFDALGRDTKVKPGDDFFRYANGGYVDRLEIPADRVTYGNFVTLGVLSENRVHKILEDAAVGKAGADPLQAKLGAYYRAYMDEARVDALGAKPLLADLDKVKAAKTHEDIAALMGDKTLPGGALFAAFVSPDAKSPTRYAVSMGSGGIGLPDRDYYLKPQFAAIRTAYRAYVEQMLTLAGWDAPAANADAIMAFETRMAEASWDRVQRRDRDKTYNPKTIAELQAMAPGFDFKRYLAAADLAAAPRVIVSDDTAFPTKAKIFAETPVSVLQAWEAFGMTDSMAGALSKPFVDARFAFRSKTLNGQPELPVRWKRAVASTDAALGEGVGKIYVAKYFPPEAKAQMLELVGNIKSALSKRIDRLEWMSPETRAQAQEKLSKFSVKIAYPDQWRDYSALQVDDKDIYGDIKRSRTFEWNYRVGAAEQAGGPQGVGHDAPDRERLLQRHAERDRVPRRDPAAALLRSQGRSGDQLWRHRRRDRPRDQPRLRRPGPQVQRRRRLEGLVDGGGRGQVQGQDRQARRAVLGVRTPAR